MVYQREKLCVRGCSVAASFMGMEPIMQLPFNYSGSCRHCKLRHHNDLIHNYGSDDFGVWAERVDSGDDVKVNWKERLPKRKGLLCHEWILENETYEIWLKLDKALNENLF